MEKTDRELLIKEISSRLPYGIKVQVFGWDEEKGEVAIPLKVYSINTDGYISFEYNHYGVETIYVEDCLLYLRPISSMTEEEREEYLALYEYEEIEYNQGCDFYGEYKICSDNEGMLSDVSDWLNAHHFDYRNLIEKGLAIEVTEENNPYKE